MSSNVVHKTKLTVAYVLPAQPPSLLRVETEETKASDPRQSEGFSVSSFGMKFQHILVMVFNGSCSAWNVLCSSFLAYAQ
jgi:hypothetical protein